MAAAAGGSEIQVKMIHKETVRPSSPTPHGLATAKLSVFDQFMYDMYVRLLLFYPISHNEQVRGSFSDERSNLLKTSLSETLSRFYPLAGRLSIQNNIIVSICCNDQGAAFMEAQVNSPMSKVLEKPDLGVLKQLLPTSLESTRESTGGYLLLVQANFFECGGVALGVSISHKAADASTFGKFITSWAATALGATDVPAAAEFGAAASTYPQLDIFNTAPLPTADYVYEAWRTTRFVFSASNISLLKSKAASASVPNPTRVEVVSALIWKCAMEASRPNLGSTRPSVWCQWANMRTVLGKPELMGNLLGHFTANTLGSKEENVQILVTKLREAIEEFRVKYGMGVSRDGVCELYNDWSKLKGKDGIESDMYNCSSWCRFPFYETDFGWGKPSWVTAPNARVKNFFLLLDTRDGGGIEASISLKEEDMALIETNEELLSYASLNPIVI